MNHVSCIPGLVILLLLSLPASAARLPDALAVPGGVVLLDLAGEPDSKPQVTYRDRPVMVVPGKAGWKAIVGIPLSSKPGQHHISVRSGENEARAIAFQGAGTRTTRPSA